MSVNTPERVDVRTAEPGDSEFFSHYVRKEAIVQAALTGAPATALCGKKWTPRRSVEGRAVCPECKEVFDDDQRFLDSDV